MNKKKPEKKPEKNEENQKKIEFKYVTIGDQKYRNEYVDGDLINIVLM